MELLCDVLNITNEFYIKTLIELIGWVFGMYIGQRIKQIFIVVMTSILGSYLTVIGALIISGNYPLDFEKNNELILLTILIIGAMSCCGIFYQKQQITKFNNEVKKRLLMQYLSLSEEDKKNVQIDKIAQTLNQNATFFSDHIFNQTFHYDIGNPDPKDVLESFQNQVRSSSLRLTDGSGISYNNPYLQESRAGSLI